VKPDEVHRVERAVDAEKREGEVDLAERLVHHPPWARPAPWRGAASDSLAVARRATVTQDVGDRAA